jgi:hypothetical protein
MEDEYRGCSIDEDVGELVEVDARTLKRWRKIFADFAAMQNRMDELLTMPKLKRMGL